jgi:CO dehydrogenase/acetyl-CoA synthase beta subunit
LTPEGFEDDLLLKDKNGRLITTDKGKMVILYDPKKLEKRIITNIPSKVVSKNLSEQEKEIIELRKTAESYPAGSFERKAIEEEIEKLNNKNSGFPPPRE